MSSRTHYHHLDLRERGQLELLTRLGHGIRDVGRLLGRAPSTIRRELVRHQDETGTYDAVRADQQARDRHHSPTRILDTHPTLAGLLVDLLLQHRSVVQALHLLATSDPDLPRVSHETVYLWLYHSPSILAGRGARALVHPRERRQPHHARHTRPSTLGEHRTISERDDLTARDTFGHWEGDLVIGRKDGSALLTLVERQTRYTIVLKLPSHRAGPTLAALRHLVRSYPPGVFTSITWDRGNEMAWHHQLTEQTGVVVYFCDPHSPWQRPTNEQTNGVLRRWVPKATTLAGIDDARAVWLSAWLNTRPMRVLSWDTPEHCFRRAVPTRDGALHP